MSEQIQVSKKFDWIFLPVVIVLFMNNLQAQELPNSIDTFYEGAPAPGVHATDKERWGFKQLADDNLISIFYARGPTGFGTEPDDVEWLADNGLDVLYQIWFWHEHDYNILDIYYNYGSCQDTVMASIDYHFNWLDSSKVWAVRLGDEEPASGYKWSLGFDPLPEGIAKYDSTYHADTGDSLKPTLSMTHSEHQRFFEWANGRDTWVLNWVHDYIKTKWPHLKVFQNVFARPLDWAYAEPYYLNADGFFYDHYSTEMDGFWDVYNTVRYYKTLFPDKPFHMMLWGISTILGQEPADRVVFKKMAWATYLGGADAIGWFQGDTVGLNYWQTIQDCALQDFEYLNAINKDLMTLTRFTPQPKVLVIGLGPSGAYKIGLFKEYDTVSEDFLAVRDFDLTPYDIIFVFGEVPYNEVVAKLNDYVRAGGNLVLATTLLPQTPQSEYGRRDAKFLFEEHGYGTEYGLDASVTIEVNSTDTLKFEFHYDDPSFQSATFAVTQDSGCFYPIGRYIIGGNEYTKGYPSFLYKAQSEHGWTLYNGYVRYEETHEQAMLIWNTFFRAFALNLLDMPEHISSEEQKGALITPAKVGEDKLLIGMVNNVTAKSFTYALNLDRFGLADGSYYVYHWENSQLYGEFTSSQGELSFPVDLPANDVQLFVVSKQPLGLDTDNALVKRFALFQNYPNPFNPNTAIRYNLPLATDVSLVVYDILGREVIRLVNEPMEPGYHQLTWNGKTATGREAPSGIYIARLVTPEYAKSIKLVLLK